MDKSKLLEEYVHLKRLLKDHESTQAIKSNNVKLDGNKVVKTNPHREGNKSTIFLNPMKLNAVNNETTLKDPEKQLHFTSKSIGKVFINPNFRKPDSISTIPVPSKVTIQEKTQKPIGNHSNESQISSSQHGYNCKKLSSASLPYQQEIISRNDCSEISKSLVAQEKSLTSNCRVIFFNPEFSSSSNSDIRFSDSSPQSSRGKISTGERYIQNLCSETNARGQMTSVNMSRKRRIVVGGDKSAKSTNYLKRMIGRENTAGAVKKIYLNPKFDSMENDSKKGESSNIDGKTSDVKANCRKFISASSSGAHTMVTQNTSIIPVLSCRKEIPSKFTSVTYPLCAIVGPNHGKQTPKKSPNPRTRTLSTSLVTISSTKLIRRRKSNQKAVESNGKVLSQPLFVSKTKLVRNVAKRTVNSSYIARIKVKQLNQKTQTQFLSTEKLSKLRRKSFTDNSFNLVPAVPRPMTVVTKMRSKNGKSLKLIRETGCIPSSSAVTMRLKNESCIRNRKMELRQQASRITMCLVQSRLKRNQFSKINVPIKVSHSQSYNENVYKKNNESRKPLTKSALLYKKDTANAVAKSHVRNTPLDMTKFIKSKYRLVRNQSTNVICKYRLCRKLMSKITPRDKLVQRKKLKWKRNSVTVKRSLTRKDLSIKKIGGVFYQYSRTTLTKNKPLCKQIPQLQSKGMFKFSSERRQNRFCLDKNGGRKQASTSGTSFITSPSGMSWRRTNHSSARSILA